MYWRISGLLLPVLVIAVIGLGMWGYQENQEKNSILIKAENQYQRAFHELTYHIDQLQDELGKTLAINSRRQIDGTLSNVWRITAMAQSEVGQLPLTLMPFNKTEEFLSQIGKFAYKAAIRDLDKDPLSEKEYQTLKTMHKRAKDIQEELRSVQTKVLDKNLRWMDVETSLAAEEESLDNTIIDGFKTIDKTVDENEEIKVGPQVNSLEIEKRYSDKNLKGRQISKEEAKRIALKFVGADQNSSQVKVAENGKGYEYSSYSVTIGRNGQDGEPIHVDVTKKGGHVIWMMDHKDIHEARISLQQARQIADRFLKNHGLNHMDAVVTEQYNNSAVITYVYKQGNVRIYPDTVTLEVGLDQGNVTGYQSQAYLFNHKDRTLPQPTITEQQARKEINPNMKVSESRLALILNDENKETLCYEFMGRIGNEVYRIFINADTGEEETVEKMDGIGQNE